MFSSGSAVEQPGVNLRAEGAYADSTGGAASDGPLASAAAAAPAGAATTYHVSADSISDDFASYVARQPLISPFSTVQDGLPPDSPAGMPPRFASSASSSSSAQDRPLVSLRAAYGGSSSLCDESPRASAHLLEQPQLQPPRRVSFAAKNPLWVDGLTGAPSIGGQSSEESPTAPLWRVPPPAVRSRPVMLKQNSVLPLPAGAIVPLRLVCLA